MYILFSVNFLLGEVAISFLIGFVLYKVFEDHFSLIPILGIIFSIAYFVMGFLAQTLHGNMLFIAGFVFLTPWFVMSIGTDLRTRIIKMRFRKTLDKKERKEGITVDRGRIYAKKREEIIRSELGEYLQLGEALKKMRSSPETLTAAEKSLLQQTAKEVEPTVGMTTIAAIGGLESWDGSPPLDITKVELDQIPDVVTVVYVCPNCREFNKFDYGKLSTPLYKAPESMNIVGGRLFTTTSHSCSKCNRTTTMTLLQCDKCTIGWQPFFYAVHTKPHSLLLTSTCYTCWDKIRDTSNLQN